MMTREEHFHFLDNYKIMEVEITFDFRYMLVCSLLSLNLLIIKIVDIIIIEIIKRSPTVSPLSFKFIALTKLY